MASPHWYFVETRQISIEAGFWGRRECVISLKQTSPASISPLSSCQTLVHFTSTLICRSKHRKSASDVFISGSAKCHRRRTPLLSAGRTRLYYPRGWDLDFEQHRAWLAYLQLITPGWTIDLTIITIAHARKIMMTSWWDTSVNNGELDQSGSTIIRMLCQLTTSSLC